MTWRRFKGEVWFKQRTYAKQNIFPVFWHFPISLSFDTFRMLNKIKEGFSIIAKVLNEQGVICEGWWHRNLQNRHITLYKNSRFINFWFYRLVCYFTDGCLKTRNKIFKYFQKLWYANPEHCHLLSLLCLPTLILVIKTACYGF